MEEAVQQIVAGEDAAAVAGSATVLAALRDRRLNVLGLVRCKKHSYASTQCLCNAFATTQLVFA